MILGISLYTWQNRASDRVLLTFFTVLFAGTIVFIAKETISNKIEKISEEISVVVLYGHDNMPLPLQLPYLPELIFFLKALTAKQRTPSQTHVDIKQGSELYFPAVVYAVIKKAMSPFISGWDSEIIQYSSPDGVTTESRGGTLNGKQVDLRYLYDLFKFQLQFEDESQIFNSSHFQKYYQPPNTDIQVTEATDFLCKIEFKNRFITLAISIKIGHHSMGAGEYTTLIGLPEDQTGSATFRIIAEVTQNRLLNGHPDMITHRKWANTIIDGIVRDFSYDKIRSNWLENFQLHGQKALLAY